MISWAVTALKCSILSFGTAYSLQNCDYKKKPTFQEGSVKLINCTIRRRKLVIITWYNCLLRTRSISSLASASSGSGAVSIILRIVSSNYNCGEQSLYKEAKEFWCTKGKKILHLPVLRWVINVRRNFQEIVGFDHCIYYHKLYCLQFNWKETSGKERKNRQGTERMKMV